jgi:TRAP-type C4-dicarboxylate transport system permease large subunit
MIMLIIIGANISGQVILMAQISQKILLYMKSLELPLWVIILSINVFLIIMGGPLEAISILVITLPILYPLMTGLGFSGIWFAVIMVINMELALISPPEGLNLFILQNMAKATAGYSRRSFSRRNSLSYHHRPIPNFDLCRSQPLHLAAFVDAVTEKGIA